MDVLTFIMEKIREKPDITKPVVEPIMTEREKQVSINFVNTLKISKLNYPNVCQLFILDLCSDNYVNK